MPELPEVETVRRGLAPALEGATIARVELRRKDLRLPFPPDFARRLTGRRILTLRRRAKYLIADLDNREALIMHLGMSGSFRIDGMTPGVFHRARDKNVAHDHVLLHPANPGEGGKATGQQNPNHECRHGCLHDAERLPTTVGSRERFHGTWGRFRNSIDIGLVKLDVAPDRT